MNPQICTKFGANRSSRLTASPNIWICDPLSPQMPPGVLRGDLDLACVHSQMNPQTWTKVGANRSGQPFDSFPKLLNVWPLKPPSAPLCLEGQFVYSHMNLHMCAKFGANLPSHLVAFPEYVLRLVRLFAAVRADSRKTQHLYIENYNSGPNMQTSTPLTFFTAILLAFSGMLAEELMILCRSVTTELYR